jgi:hypothetical protein
MKVTIDEVQPGDLLHVAPDKTLTLLVRDGEQMCCTADPEPVPGT